MKYARLVEQIHASSQRIVVALSGGGSQALAELLEVPGASRTVLEAVVPYCEPAMIAWLGGRPDQFCSAATARAMAMAAFRRARGYDNRDDLLAGVACTAGLATDRPRRGGDRAHVALQTAALTATWSLELEKGHRERSDEESLVSRMVLNAVAEAGGLSERLSLDLLPDEHLDESRTVAPQAWRDLLLGKIDTAGQHNPSSAVIFPGAFNPLHDGHRRIVQIAREILNDPISLDISIFNVDKPPLDYFEIERRLRQFTADQPLWLTRAATFLEKSALFPGATFLVGVDTLRRIADPRYYPDAGACQVAVERIVARACRFLVFGRDMGTGFVRLADLDLPERLRAVCREVALEEFREDVSSMAMRKSGTW